MKLITEDINNKTFLIHLTKDELDQIQGLAYHYVGSVNSKNITKEDKEFLYDLHNLCSTISAHLYHKGGDE